MFDTFYKQKSQINHTNYKVLIQLNEKKTKIKILCDSKLNDKRKTTEHSIRIKYHIYSEMLVPIFNASYTYTFARN